VQASGRALEGIEDFVRTEVLPVYANTHTTASATGMQTTLFRAEARSIVRRALGCENNRDAVLFTGTGCTGAIGKMLDLLKVPHCNTLQHTATHPSNISANILTSSLSSVNTVASQLTATHCNTLQHTATHCNSLQLIATLPPNRARRGGKRQQTLA